MIRLFLADEQPVVLAGLRSFFSGTEFHVVGEATNGLELVRGLEHTRPHLVLVDTGQASFEGFTEGLLSGILKASHWEFKVVEWTPSLKSSSKQTLLDTVRHVAPKRISARGNRLPPAPAGSLTPRELEIIRLIVQGLCNKEIARTLGISLETVKEHVQNILRKTSLSDRTQAALWAVRQEIVSL